ncbi:MAG TPA: purine-nucleoside phosphorylase [Planctomycetota bacterium]|nr:purine-nucleoside phosphorylase [Planctomycetota bacterium]
MSTPSLYDRVHAAADAVSKILPSRKPKAAVVLGTGLGGLAKQITNLKELPYSQIPHFPVSTVSSHAGRVVTGFLGEAPVLAFDGRFHLYEGWSFEQVTMPVRVAKALGAEVLFLSGAVGGMNPLHEKGDLVLLEDHINLLPGNPLIGPNDERLGPRFPDMCAPYDAKLLRRAEEICLEEKIRAHRGVYVAVSGPNLETRAEYRFLRTIGADVVGMSTVPECIVAVHSGLKVFAATIITDRCLPDALEPANIAQIIAVANAAEPKLTRVVSRLIAEL